jgi:hypothetical protein
MAKCQDCEEKKAKHHDPRDPPLDTEICLCTGCYDNALSDMESDLHLQTLVIAQTRDKLRKAKARRRA